jgi:hypothetical protein
VGPRTGLDNVEKRKLLTLPGFELRTLRRPASSQSLYRLRYPGSLVSLSPFGTSATNWPIVPAHDDRWWAWSSRWNEKLQGKPKYAEKTCSSATLLTMNPTWRDPGSNPGLPGGNSAINSLSYGAAYLGSFLQCYEWMNLQGVGLFGPCTATYSGLLC